jgi:formamidopyrimidine-DNA glycosylase
MKQLENVFMPELPEVECFKRKIEKGLKGKRISSVEVSPDDIVFSKKKPHAIKKILLESKVKKLGRKGKYFWIELDKKPWPVFHLGMTGKVLILDEAPKKPEKFVKLTLEAEDGTIMIFKDARRFGRIVFLDDPFTTGPLSRLGFDAEYELPTAKTLTPLIQKKHAPIKAILLDQAFIAGIGNWMADEILYQAGIDPRRIGAVLTTKEISKLRMKIASVVKIGVRAKVQGKEYPESWLFHSRWGKKKGATYKGKKLTFSTVGGRTTAWVPSHQV